MGTYSSAASSSHTFHVARPDGPFRRADLELHGLDHSKASYEGRVFLNNSDASVSTPTDEAHGYVGSFFIFGHGGCAGEEGHCDVPSERRPFDRRMEHQLTSVSKRVVITDALKRALERAGDSLDVTIVPVVEPEDAEFYSNELLSDLLKLDRIGINTYL